MMYDYKVILGILAVVVGLIGYVPYYRDIFRGTTKPHPFSWFAFALLMGITFFAQIFTGAGPGAWVTGVSAVAVFGIAILSILKGHREITTFDWFCFAGALLGIVLWRATDDPLWAVVIVTVTDAIAFAPTYRKAYIEPHEETASLFVFSAAKYFISLFALVSFNLTTALFPVSLVATNAVFAFLILVRRRQLAKR
ncbi:MAG: hypothetical protein AAB790_02060 [Patescibacteria group bacterium]